MIDLSNEQVLANWQECNKDGRQQGADYWYDFMLKCGRKGADEVVATMDGLNNL